MGKRIISRRRGKGTHVYRSPSHRHLAPVHYPEPESWSGRVEDILHAPGRTAPMIKVRLDSGAVSYMLAPEGIAVGDTVAQGPLSRLEPGHVYPLGDLPDGIPVFNLEIRPGDGGKLVRTAGGSATVVSHGAEVLVQMPSGQFKGFHPRCRATIGCVAGGGRRDKPITKAGTRHRMLKAKAKKMFPTVSGVAMNPVNHPHGGGSHQHVGGPSTVPRGAPPGAKVGRFSPKKRSKGRRRR